MEKIYALTQDNGSCNNNGFRKYTVKISESYLVAELKSYFRWRKDVTYSRLMKQGSYDYDRFIKYLHKSGY